MGAGSERSREETDYEAVAQQVTGLPVTYLEAYPFPAFAFSAHEPLVRRRGWPTETIWENSKWRAVSRGRNWQSFVDPESAGKFCAWLEQDGEPTFELDLTHPPVSLPFTKVVQGDPLHYYIVTALAPGPHPLQHPLPRATFETATPLSASNSLISAKPAHRLARSTTLVPSPLSSPAETDCKTLLETTDWSKTSLGLRSTWSPVLETMIAIVMASPTQDSLWLGADFNMIYNQHYSAIVKHPLMFGKSAKVKEAWGPVWDSVYHLIERCLDDSEPCFFENDLLLYRMGSRGHFIEKYHTWSFVPIYDHDGKPLGLYNPTRETTAAVLAERRQATLRDITEQLAPARSHAEYFERIAETAELNPKDIPFLACYSVDKHDDTRTTIKLESTVGVPANHPSMPSTLQIDTRIAEASQVGRDSPGPSSAASTMSSGIARVHSSNETTAWPIAQALRTRQCVVVEDCASLVEGFPLRQWENLPDSAIVIPISNDQSTSQPRAVLIMGLNIRCPLDHDYEEWIQVFRAHLASSLGSIWAYAADEQRRLDMEKMERAKTAWFQGAAHDLRTPLTLVAGPLDDVLRTNLSAAQRKALNLAQHNLTRIQRLVNTLLDFSRIEAGKLEGRFVPTNLGVFVADLTVLFRPAIERMGIAFDVHIAEYDQNVVVDPTLFETAVTNLLSNALKYTREGCIKVDLTFIEYAVLTISDSGIGIPSADLERVTDRFHRAQTGITSGTEGTGIGLALVKEIVRLHQGELLITSNTADENQGVHGSTFTVRIPLSARPISEDVPRPTFGLYGRQLADEAMRWGSASDNTEDNSDIEVNSVESESLDGSGLLFDSNDVLLLVDDTRDMRQYIKQVFSPYCRVVECSNGEEALEYARRNPPDLILSDLMMPKMNGQELLEAIRADARTRLVPMVLLSAATNDELRLAAFTAGAEEFMLKPFKPRELVARVNLHMQIGKRRRALEVLYASREKEIALLSDYCPTGIVRTDTNGIVIYANAAWYDYCGISTNADPNCWRDLLEPDSRERLVDAWEDFIRGDKSDMQVKWRWVNGKTVEGHFLHLDKFGSGLSGVLGCLQDVSYQEERLIEAERRRMEAEEAKRQQELLVDFTSHEIRTPVSAILQCSSLVRDNLSALKHRLQASESGTCRPDAQFFRELDEDIEALESIYQCGLVQERIAADVLSLARIQLDMLSLYDVDRDLKQEAKKVVSVFASEAKMKKIELVLEFGDTIEQSRISMIKTDHVRLGQVITNLVSNAIRFTATSARRIITVRYDVAFVPPDGDTCACPSDIQLPNLLPPAKDTPLWLFVSVKDTGPGLGTSELQKLFQRFSQGSKMIHSRYGGSGLGLFICRKITELLGGRIEVLSELGHGSEFRFYIRCLSSAQPLHVDVPESPHSLLLSTQSSGPANPETIASPPTLIDQRRVLIVEDNIINQTVLRRQLTKAGFACQVASDGQVALDNLFQTDFKPDVILMDLEMPVMDGLTAIKLIRQAERDGGSDSQLVIALTGNARQGQIDQALEAGMDDVVIKPYKLPQLIAKIEAAIGSKKRVANDTVP